MMIEQRGRVVARDKQGVWVESQRQQSCGGCHSSQGCGTATVAKLFGNRLLRIHARDVLGVEVGDEVTIGVSENGLLLGSFVIYLIPLILLLAVAIIADTLAGNDLLTVVAALLALLLSLPLIRWLQQQPRLQRAVEAVVLARLPTAQTVSFFNRIEGV
ncbi:MAG: SoxR reducing system RseC family protein [Gammaproteobacteria bacterium]|nr:SoxR reducing system RseC family protein [Gammaproteobacteria bacterium]